MIAGEKKVGGDHRDGKPIGAIRAKRTVRITERVRNM
jgi:hypothetical protein